MNDKGTVEAYAEGKWGIYEQACKELSMRPFGCAS